jgi:acetyltransferase-like isoleucine patch superfamily enzyme
MNQYEWETGRQKGRVSINRVRDMPWALGLELRRIIYKPWVFLKLAINGISWGDRSRFYGIPLIQKFRGSVIKIGDEFVCRSWVGSNPLAPNHPLVLATRNSSASISIGDGCGFTGNTIVAESRIEIGDRVYLGSNSIIVDTDFHPLKSENRSLSPRKGETEAVRIDDDVFVGMNVIIMKGVHIGQGSVVGAGSVVTKDIPAGVVAGGNPARILKRLDE